MLGLNVCRLEVRNHQCVGIREGRISLFDVDVKDVCFETILKIRWWYARKLLMSGNTWAGVFFGLTGMLYHSILLYIACSNSLVKIQVMSNSCIN